MKVAAVGRTQFLHDTVGHLAANGHEIALICTAAAAPEYTRREDDLERLAAACGCPFLLTDGTFNGEALSLVRKTGADVIVSVNWPTLLPEALLAEPRHGVLNAHAGDLPRYRGNACPNWAILNGEPYVAFTVHRMTPDLDAGAIVTQAKIPLTDDTYIGDVYAAAEAIVPELFLQAISGLESGSLAPRPQETDPRKALRTLPRRPEDGHIDWAQPARQLGRLVRASAEPFAGAFTFLEGRLIRVWRARAVSPDVPLQGVPGQVVRIDRAQGCVDVLAGDGNLLRLETAEAEAGRVAASQVVRSTRQRLGLDLVAETLRLRALLGTSSQAPRAAREADGAVLMEDAR